MTLPVIEPIIPKLSRHVPTGKEWRYEAKLDGFRGTLYVENGKAWFRSKATRVMKRFQPLADSIAKTMNLSSGIFDGEIIVMTERTPDFYALMFHRGQPEYAAFDLLWKNGRDLRGLSYNERKKRLRATLATTEAIGYVEHYDQPALFEAATQLDLEGIVAKRKSDTYDPSAEWVKVKHPSYSQAEGRHDLFRR
jgi:bifunctional non-homologous end joining protein LigD